MKRALFYGLALVAFVAAIFIRIEAVKKERSAETVSIAKEFEKHGKPVEIYTVKREDLAIFERLTGEFRSGKARLYVSKLQWRAIRAGAQARAMTPQGDEVFGEVAYVSKTSDRETGLYPVEVRLQKGARIKPGQSLVVDIGIQILEDILKVPSASISTSEAGNFVWVLEDGKAKKKNVVEGAESENYTQILKGLESGEKVIVRGASALEEGDVARIIALESERGDEK